MAWRDSRRNRARLVLFISAITVGIAALTAVRSFSVNLMADIDREAKTLLGADLSLDANQPVPDSILAKIELPEVEKAKVLNFMSMVRFPKGGGTRLSLIRSLEGNYPYYGKWKTARRCSRHPGNRHGKRACRAENRLREISLRSGRRRG